MEHRRSRSLTVLLAAVVGAIIGALVARWVFGESDPGSMLVIAGAAALASWIGATLRTSRRSRRSR
ncbi:hypothetical protein [Cellulomonas taurus]|uniref:hypothetical protein n=1 Tax=Cellulomonas taurus TaxID=2729175 RepID=UPI00145FA6FF|nr:hypothetical protein [Cellulomonas taurus]